MGELEGRVAIITGGGSGIGAATARRFVAEGATVALFDRDPESVIKVAAEVNGHAYALDVRDGMAVGQGWVPGAAGVPVARALATLADAGARNFIVTAIERDGLLTGPNLELLGQMVDLNRGGIVASAGVSTLTDVAAVRALGCTGAIVGRSIYEGHLDLAAAVRLVEMS